MTIIINPGTGPVFGATVEEASKNMAQLIIDAHIPDATFERMPTIDDRGRFGFRVLWGNKEWEVEMPGLPLERVRWLGSEGQNIWDFPRLYLDGSSWVWKYAMEILDEEAHNPEAEEE